MSINFFAKWPVLMFCVLALHTFETKANKDHIITMGIAADTIECKIKSIGNGYVIFKTLRDSSEKKYSLYKIQSIKLNANKHNDIITIPSVKFDTINCHITQITNNTISYYLENKRVIHEIRSNYVFACFFNEIKHHPKLDSLNQLKYKLINFKRHTNFGARIITVNNSEILFDKIEYSETKGLAIFNRRENKIIKSNLAISNADKILLNSFDIKSNFFQNTRYLTKIGNLVDIKILEVNEDNLEVEYNSKSTDRTIRFFLDKEEILALIFFDYSSIKEASSRNNSLKHRKMGFNLFGGIGRLVTEEQASEELNDHNIELSSGIHFGLNLNGYLSPNSGIGFTYRYFHSQNSSQELKNTYISGIKINSVSDNVNIHYFGINYIFGSLPSKDVMYDFILSGGMSMLYWSEVINSDIHLNLSGLAPSVGITNRLGFNITKGFSIYLDLSIKIGLVNDVKVNNTKSGEKLNISRVELGGGIKFY